MTDEPLSAYIRRVNGDPAEQEVIAKGVEAMERHFDAIADAAFEYAGNSKEGDALYLIGLKARSGAVNVHIRDGRREIA